MKRFILLFAFVCLLGSCSKTMEFFNWSLPKIATVKSVGFNEFLIPRGEHESQNNKLKQVKLSELRFQVIFDSSAIYQTTIPQNQLDINKLYGFSDCESVHHENSARFGWCWNGKAIEIHAYWYADGLRFSRFLDTISIGNTYEFGLAVKPGQYAFEVKKQKYYTARHCGNSFILGYQLYPYFGGDEAAPHDIRIKIKNL